MLHEESKEVQKYAQIGPHKNLHISISLPTTIKRQILDIVHTFQGLHTALFQLAGFTLVCYLLLHTCSHGYLNCLKGELHLLP